MAEELSMDELQLEFERLQREERLVEEALEAENKRIRTEFLAKKNKNKNLKKLKNLLKIKKIEENLKNNNEKMLNLVKMKLKKRKKSKIN